jgi:hypothetical protein
MSLAHGDGGGQIVEHALQHRVGQPPVLELAQQGLQLGHLATECLEKVCQLVMTERLCPLDRHVVLQIPEIGLDCVDLILSDG